MKLYVIGESSSDPEKWSIWSELSLVIATSKGEALKLCDDSGGIATEIPMDSPVVLVSMPEPNWGEDL